MTEQQLEDRLSELAAGLDVPPADPDGALRLGRRRRTRRRLAAVGSMTAVALVVGGAAWSISEIGGDERAGTRIAGNTAAPSPSTAPSGADDPADPTADPTDPADPTDRADPTLGGGVTATERSVVLDMRRAVARHLDPAGEHITAEEIDNVNVQASSEGGDISSLGTRVGWTNPGEGGEGMVSVSVSSEPTFSCAVAGSEGSVCSDRRIGGLQVTWVVDEASGETPLAAWRRPDGQVVTVALDDLFGNNSTTAISGIDVSDAQLAALLQDEAFALPGAPAAGEEAGLDGRQVRDRTLAALGADADRLRVTSFTGTNIEGQVVGDWVGSGSTAGTLMVTDGVGNMAVDAPCATWFAERCAFPEVEGFEVRIDYRRASTGGGYDVTAEGPTRTIWVMVDDDDRGDGWFLSPDAAVALATDAALQE